MTVVIMTDLEGISGVDDISMIDESGEGYRFACAQLMKDTNAAVAGCFDGGATRDSFLMQFQADVLGKNVLRPGMRETTALGAAYLAGLGCGFYESTDELRANNPTETTFTPSIGEEKRKALLDGWHDAVRRTLSGK